MGNFLLIHGGSHGAWCWERTRQALESRGHRALSFDLPGHGADQSPRSEITRQTYVLAVESYIQAHQLTDLFLVGHSLAGTFLPDLVRRNPSLFRSVVFLAALVLSPGEAAIDLIPEERKPIYFELAKRSDDNSILLDQSLTRVAFFSDLTDAEALLYHQRLTPQPLGVYLDRNQIDLNLFPASVRYILCTNDHALPRELCLSCAAKLRVTPEEIASGHDVMLSHPVELVDLLLRPPERTTTRSD